MKKLIILSAIAMSGFIYNTANAQIGIHVGLRFAPRRAPVVVEQASVYVDNDNDDYYYLPDVDAYYDVTAQCYFYFDGGNWVSAAYLPGVYRDYDWRNATRYEVRGYRPYLHNDVYRARYSGHVVADWSRGYEHRDQNAYAQPAYRHDERFDDRGRFRHDEHFDNREQNHRDEHFDARGREGFSQPEQPNRSNGQHFDNREQFNHPAYQNQGRENPNRGGNNDHYAQNNRGGHDDHRRGW